MVKENSGKIYLLPLNFEMGFALCKMMDYTDIAPFDGVLVSVLQEQFNSSEEVPSITEIDKLAKLFGPLPLNKYPNIKGKGAWKYVGQTELLDKEMPFFKGTVERVALYRAIDWTTINKWYKNNLTDKEIFCNYESVRRLETRTLYDMNCIEIRATMNFLLLNKMKVENYYDLSNERNRNLYLQMVNTSFDKKSADKYLEAIVPSATSLPFNNHS